jgi:hypothetical protein
VTGWKKTTSLILISITALSIPSVLLLSTPTTARAASLSHRLTVTHRRLRHARAKLTSDRLAYAAALAAANGTAALADTTPSPTPSATSDPSATPSPVATPSPNATPSPAATPTPAASPVPSLHQLRLIMLADQRRVRKLRKLAVHLHREIVMEAAAARGDWMPIVRDAARHSHISATGLRRMMSFESGGRVHAENGSFHGLYQYSWSTWRGAWNPWRHYSLYDGEAQIRATAVAIHRGWGAQMWPNTYPRAF